MHFSSNHIHFFSELNGFNLFVFNLIIIEDNIFHKCIYLQIVITVYCPQKCAHHITHGTQASKQERKNKSMEGSNCSIKRLLPLMESL